MSAVSSGMKALPTKNTVPLLAARECRQGQKFNPAKEVLPLRNKFAPKSHTIICELDARFEFGGEN